MINQGLCEKSIVDGCFIILTHGVSAHGYAILRSNNTSQAYDQHLLDTLKPGGFYFLGSQ